MKDKYELITKLLANPMHCEMAILDCLKTLKTPLNPKPIVSHVCRAAIMFMGKYDPNWIPVTPDDYTQSRACFK